MDVVTGQRPRRPGSIVVALVLAILVTALVFHSVRLSTDMADFLPQGRTEAQRFMLRELRSGAGSSLILVGIEQAPPAELARISAAMAATLQRSGRFGLVANGPLALDGPDQALLLRERYLLSPATTPDAFSGAALHRDLSTLLDALQSSAGPLVETYGFSDPTGSFLGLMQGWGAGRSLRIEDGVWFAPERDRALILLRTRAGGMDIPAQTLVDQAIRSAFAASRPGAARLLASGPAVFARAAAASIRGDIELLSTVSTLLVAGVLVWRFRSPWVLATIAIPVLLSLSAAALVVRARYGYVHGIAFGFGMTMLGVTLDYPVLLIGHRDRGEPATGTLTRIGATLRLAVLTAALGLTGMIASGFPGLAQLGLFSAVGVLVAAAVTLWLLPRLIVAADLAPLPPGDPSRLLRVERLRRGRGWAALPIAAALLLLALHPPHLETDLESLSPVPLADRQLDAALRRELGAADAGQLAMLRAPTADALLAREEVLAPRLDRLQADGAMTGYDDAARIVPSLDLQRRRQAALPDPATLRASLSQAEAGLPFRDAAFAPFLSEVASARSMPPLRPGDITTPILSARLQPLLLAQDGGWVGVIVPNGLRDPAAFRAALQAEPGLTLIDMHRETNDLVLADTRHAWRWLGYGAALAAVALAVGLRDRRRLARVVGAVAAALLVTLAILSASGVGLSLIHIVSLQFVAGIGLDYALFFARPQLDRAERARTLRTLVTCNTMTLLTFGLLAFCRTPILHDIGFTVAIGAILAMGFSFLLAAPPAAAADPA